MYGHGGFVCWVWPFRQIFIPPPWGWVGDAKVSCILRHQGVQLILAYSWARPTILAEGKGRGGMFLFLLFLHCHSFSFLSCPSPFITTTSSISLLPFPGGQHKMTLKGWRVLNPNSIPTLRRLDKKCCYKSWTMDGRGQQLHVKTDKEADLGFWFHFIAKQNVKSFLTSFINFCIEK